MNYESLVCNGNFTNLLDTGTVSVVFKKTDMLIHSRVKYEFNPTGRLWHVNYLALSSLRMRILFEHFLNIFFAGTPSLVLRKFLFDNWLLKKPPDVKK